MVTISPVVSEEFIENVAGQRTTEPSYLISSPGTFDLDELKKKAVNKPDVLYTILNLKADNDDG